MGTDSREEIDIRKAMRADLLSVFRIEKQSFDQPWPYAAFEEFLGSPGFFVAETGPLIIGYVVGETVSTRGGRLGHIKDIAVAPAHRRQGIARMLLSRSLVALATSGVSRVKLEVRKTNQSAQSLYSEFGFEPHHTISTYYDDGEDAYVLVKEFGQQW